MCSRPQARSPTTHPPASHRVARIVLHELLTWQLPFGPANPWHLVAHVLAGGRLDIPPREALPGPDTVQFGGLDGYIALMQQCWAQAQEERPNFQQVVQELRWAGWGGLWGCQLAAHA